MSKDYLVGVGDLVVAADDLHGDCDDLDGKCIFKIPVKRYVFSTWEVAMIAPT